MTTEVSCLDLFTALSKNDDSSDYQVKRIFKLLDLHQSKPISLPNSKIFSQISKGKPSAYLRS